MATQFLKPKDKYLLRGSWGERTFSDQSKMSLYHTLHRELIASKLFPKNAMLPSNKSHYHVTATIMGSSWDQAAKKWVKDDPEHEVEIPVVEERVVIKGGYISLYAIGIPNGEYFFETYRCDDSAKLFGWILHLTHKTWFTPTLCGELISVVTEATGIEVRY